MTVTVDLNPEIAKGLMAQARERGVSLADYLQEIVTRQARLATASRTANGKAPELPLLHLGVMGALHRRDIYDVR
jgi:hypothetical protein